MNFNNATITLTFGDQAENHVGMQKIGQLADSGFTMEDLKSIKKKFKKAKIINLTNGAGILIIKNGVDELLKNNNPDDLFNEQNSLKADKKAKMYGRVVNKKARYNLCFGDKGQKPDYINGMGTIVAYNDVPLTKEIRDNLVNYFGSKSDKLCCEGNYYYDIDKCFIGFHGDAERRRVIGVRLGEDFPLIYQWYQNGQKVGKPIKINLSHGDIYVMSEKAVGYDWKKKKILTLRHAAGFTKNIEK